MKVRDIMQSQVASCSVDSLSSEAARIMWDHDCGIVPVIDALTGKIRGVVTDRDLCMAAFMRGLPLGRIPVAEAMSSKVVSCQESDSIGTAHELLREHQVRRLVVVDAAERLIGILSLNDLARHEATGRSSSAGKRERELSKTLAAVCQHRAEATAGS